MKRDFLFQEPISRIYNLLESNKDYNRIRDACFDPDIIGSEPFNLKKKELDNQRLIVRNRLSNLSDCTEEMNSLTKQCLALIDKEKEKQKFSKEHEKRYRYQ